MYPLNLFIKEQTDLKTLNNFSKNANIPATTLQNYKNRETSVLDYPLYLLKMLSVYADQTLDKVAEQLIAYETEYQINKTANLSAEKTDENNFAESGQLEGFRIKKEFSAADRRKLATIRNKMIKNLKDSNQQEFLSNLILLYSLLNKPVPEKFVTDTKNWKELGYGFVGSITDIN